MELEVTKSGDIALSAGGVNRLSINDAIAQRIYMLLRSKPGDWELYPTFGANITKYVGYPNLPATRTIIEEDLLEELSLDRMLGSLSFDVNYTPIDKTEAMIEITCYLPNEQKLIVTYNMDPDGALFTNNGLPFTSTKYSDQLGLVYELIEVSANTNTIKISRTPADSQIFIVNYDPSISINAEEGLSLTPEIYEYTYDLSSFAYIGDVPSGLPSLALSDRIYKLPGNAISIIDNFYISSYDVSYNGISLDTNDYNIDNYKIELKNPEYVLIGEGQTDLIGVEEIVSGEIKLSLNYYNSFPISEINSYEIDSVPNNLYPRTREVGESIVTTKVLLQKGTYFVQYLAYKLEG